MQLLFTMKKNNSKNIKVLQCASVLVCNDKFQLRVSIMLAWLCAAQNELSLPSMRMHLSWDRASAQDSCSGRAVQACAAAKHREKHWQSWCWSKLLTSILGPNYIHFPLLWSMNLKGSRHPGTLAIFGESQVQMGTFVLISLKF